jgi:hypothetical protein
VAGRPNDLQSRFGRETCPCGDVEDAHTRRNMSRAKEVGYEVSRDAGEGSVVTGRRFILICKFFCPPGLSFGSTVQD